MTLTLASKIKLVFLLTAFFGICTESLMSQQDMENTGKDGSRYVPFKTVMLSSFKGVNPNVIQDSTHSLSSFFEKLSTLQNPVDTGKTVVRIVQIGDSHVRSHEFTPALHIRLTEVFGNAATGYIEGYRSGGILEENGSSGVICDCIGINGATSQNFIDDKYMTDIQQLQPDLIIISLGTNESFSKYDSSSHYDMMNSLFSMLKSYCPEASILYTTPPGSYKVIYRRYRKRKRIYRRVVRVEENRNMGKVASTIVKFAADHHAASWDLFNVAGGEKYACKNWLSGNYFQRDRVHFVSGGYALQGNLLYEAIINGYNEYITKNE